MDFSHFLYIYENPSMHYHFLFYLGFDPGETYYVKLVYELLYMLLQQHSFVESVAKYDMYDREMKGQ